MVYADLIFYTEDYCGSVIPEDEFNNYALKSSKRIEFYTGSIEDGELTDDIKFAACEVADILYQDEVHGNIKYERNDGYWVSYDEGTCVDESIEKCIKTWLSGSGLLYRGRMI